jgi:GTP-binding protein
LKIETARFVRSAFGDGDLLRDGKAEVAFVGRSNVGKSSLLNRLLGRKALARISSTPGRTRSVNYFLVNDRYYFVDLPGYGYAKTARKERESWGDLVDRYFRRALPRGGHVVQLIDAKVGATALDVEAWEYLRDLGASPVVVATKVDRLPSGRRAAAVAAAREALAGSDPIPVSARSGEGMSRLWKELTDRLRSRARS